MTLLPQFPTIEVSPYIFDYYLLNALNIRNLSLYT